VLVREAKRQVLDQLLQADLGRLVQRAYEFATLERQWGDFTRPQMYAALQHVIASLPVYRTYVRSGQAARTVDEGHLVAAIEQARRDCVELDATLSAFLRELLTGRIPCAAAQQLVAAFQQLSGPAMAKGLEDTAFYRYVRLLSLNEVGGDPGRFGVSVDAFHRFCAQLQRDWPLSMVCTSTHDTKRSEDVRSRISLLSEMPERWESLLHRLSELARGHRDGSLVDGPTEYLFWQTLVGAWPISTERMTSYLLKAVREAKRRTSWTRADQKYEDAILQYARRVLSDPKIVAELSEFVREIEGPARRASLAQLLLKLSAPGVPDIYQGTELWELSLVDPDNRRAVDFATRRRLLAELAHLSCAEVLARSHEGLPKLFVTYHALRLRRRRPECFGAAGAYRPLRTRGRHADRVVAFARGDKVASIAPRLLLGLHDGWGDTTVELPAGQFVSVFCGGPPVAGRVRVSALLEQFPVALLEEVDAQ
jgi:(1->4)-alpha-D-glucan 1-alpha-D-glucosylmutase